MCIYTLGYMPPRQCIAGYTPQPVQSYSMCMLYRHATYIRLVITVDDG